MIAQFMQEVSQREHHGSQSCLKAFVGEAVCSPQGAFQLCFKKPPVLSGDVCQRQRHDEAGNENQ